MITQKPRQGSWQNPERLINCLLCMRIIGFIIKKQKLMGYSISLIFVDFCLIIENSITKLMQIPEASEFCFSLFTFSKLLFPFFFFMVLSFNIMRLSIGSVVVALMAVKGRVWVCRFFEENTIRHRRMEIFGKTGGLNLHIPKTRIYLCHRNNNGRTERPNFKIVKQEKEESFK